MIRAVLPGDSLFAPSAAGPDPYGAIHTARWELYGRGAGPPRFWRTPKADGVLSLSGDTLVLSGRFSDSEELAAFCAICGAKTLRGPASALAETDRPAELAHQSRQILSAVGVLRQPLSRREFANLLPGRSIRCCRGYLICRKRILLPGTARFPTSCAISRGPCWAYGRKGRSLLRQGSIIKTNKRL